MKALKNCKWKVEIILCCDGNYYWSANPQHETGIRHRCGEDFVSAQLFSKTGAKLNWRHFAKINGIENWKYEGEMR